MTMSRKKVPYSEFYYNRNIQSRCALSKDLEKYFIMCVHGWEQCDYNTHANTIQSPYVLFSLVSFLYIHATN